MTTPPGHQATGDQGVLVVCCLANQWERGEKEEGEREREGKMEGERRESREEVRKERRRWREGRRE